VPASDAARRSGGGEDGVSRDEYGLNSEEDLTRLSARLRLMGNRPQAKRRSYIRRMLKGDPGRRPRPGHGAGYAPTLDPLAMVVQYLPRQAKGSCGAGLAGDLRKFPSGAAVERTGFD